MRSKATVLALLMMVTVFIVITLIPRERSYDFSDILISEDAWNDIKSSRVNNPLLNVSEFSFGGQKLQLDSDYGRYFYSIVGDSESSDHPEITIPRGNQLNVAVLKSTFSLENIVANKAFKMLVYSNFSYREINIITTILPIMNIDTLGKHEVGDEASAARIRLFDNRENVRNREFISDAKIKLRGSTSRILEKKSYKINLLDGKNSNHADLLGMRRDDDWILSSLYGDQEKVRNILSAQLWYDCCTEHNEFGAPNSFEYRYVELFVDNSYAGLYLLGYKPDKRTADLGSNEYVFKNNDWANAKVLREDPNFARYYELDTSYADEEKAQSELKSFLDIIENGTPEEIRANFDIRNAIDIELHAQLTAETDYVKEGKTKNLYLTVKDTSKGRKILYTPWDFDLSFGNVWTSGLANNTSTKQYGLQPDVLVESAATPIAALIEKGDPKIMNELKARYKELRKSAWSGRNIYSLISGYEIDVFTSGAYIRDQNRWPRGNYIDGIKDYSKLKKFVRERLEFLDEYYDYNQ